MSANDGKRSFVMLSEASVLAAIDDAFKEAAYPDGHLIVAGDSFEELEIRDLLLNRQWHDVDVDMLDAYDEHGDLSVMPLFLSQSAAVYFMPAFLKYVVSKGGSSGLILRVLLNQFNEGKGPFDPASYSRDQRAAISQIMAYLEQVFEANNEEYDLGLVRECSKTWNTSLAKLG
jgi:hypothetical protein